MSPEIRNPSSVSPRFEGEYGELFLLLELITEPAHHQSFYFEIPALILNKSNTGLLVQARTADLELIKAMWEKYK